MVPSKYFGALAPGYHNSRSAPARATTARADADDARDARRAVAHGRAIAACLEASIVCARVMRREVEWGKRAWNALAKGPCERRVAERVGCTKVTPGARVARRASRVRDVSGGGHRAWS